MDGVLDDMEKNKQKKKKKNTNKFYTAHSPHLPKVQKFFNANK